VTNFLKELYIKFDFEAAKRKMLAEQVVGDDLFFGEFREDFLDNARY
jgi:translation initiation factor 3 subunit E